MAKMNFVDRAIGVFSPKAALRRLQQREALALLGGYNGASLRRPALQNWNPYSGDANSDTITDLPTLRARSRDLARNAPIGGAAINAVVSNVIGTGLSMQANPDAETLGWSDEQTGSWKKLVEAEWHIWSSSTDCDATRTMNFYGLQSLALRSMLESGDVITITPMISDRAPYQLALQLIEADRLCNKDNAMDTETKIAGITFDTNGAAISYDIAKRHPGAMRLTGQSWITINARGDNGRQNVIHLFERKRPGQVRGVPYLAPVIEHLKQITRYSDAELQAAVVSAAFAVFLKMDADAFGSVFNEEHQSRYIDRVGKWDGKVDVESPGNVINLMPGEEATVPNLGRPNANFDPFFLAMLKQIGPALEIPFEVLVKHFSSSYSASRAALLDFWRIVRVRRDFMATYFCEPIKQLWLEEAVSTGRIPAPGFFADPRLRQAYSRVSWIGDGPGSIDPEKEINAAVKRINAGVSTLEKEAAAYDGGDWEANIKQREKEKKMMDDAGLTIDPNQNSQTLPPQS